MLNGKPMILVTSDSNFASVGNSAPRQLVSPKAYTAAVAASGAVPLLTSECCAEELAELGDGLLLSGGDDVDPELYGETLLNASVAPDPARTAFEVPLARLFLMSGKPILTVCRGFQLLNCLLGGDLYQDLLEQCGYIHSDKALYHPLFAEPDSRLFRLFGAEFRVNSTHHQAVRRLGEGLRATAHSVEGIVEAYEHNTRPIFGVQFHPERLTGPLLDARTPDFAPFFAEFTELCRQNAAEREEIK